MDLLSSSCTSHCQHYHTFENLLPLGALELNTFNNLCLYQVSFVFPSPALVALVFPRTCHRLMQTSNSCCTSLDWDPWLFTVLNILEYIPHQCPFIKDLVMEVLVDQVLKGMSSLYVSLWLLRGTHCADKGSFPQSAGRVTSASTTMVHQQCWKEWAG